MNASAIERWLRRKSLTDGLLYGVAAFGSWSIGFILIAVWFFFSFYLLDQAASETTRFLLGDRPALTAAGFLRAGAFLLALGVVACLFAAYVHIRDKRERWNRPPRPQSERPHGVPFPFAYDASLRAELALAGPRLVMAALACAQKAVRLLTLDASRCAQVLTLLLSRDSRASFEEIWQQFPLLRSERLLAQLREIEGVVFLQARKPGLSLNADLRAELHRVAFRERKSKTPPPNEPRAKKAKSFVPPDPPLDSELLRSFAVLGLPPTASLADMKRAYRKLMKENHPDRLPKWSGEFRALAEERSKQINHAYKFLISQFEKERV